MKDAYHDLFADHGDEAWTLESNALITFFRQSDESSGIVGARQANTFRAVSALAGHADIPEPKIRRGPRKTQTPKSDEKKTTKAADQTSISGSRSSTATSPVGLTVRIEVNLPADGDQETYDKIFQSIRKNLIDGK